MNGKEGGQRGAGERKERLRAIKKRTRGQGKTKGIEGNPLGF